MAFCEIEPFAVRILNKRFPGIPVFDDVRKITRGTIEELLSGKDYSDVVELYERGMTVEEIAIIHNAPVGFMRGVLRRRGIDIKGEEEVMPDGSLGTIDVVHGGFPCQDLSVAGKQRGLSGERSGLWFEMLRVVSELRPAYVLAENVRGACNLALPAVVSGLEGEGYEVRASVVPASAFGAPHKRERLFVLGVRSDVAYAVSERLQRGEWGCAFSEQGAPALKPASERCEGGLWPTPSASSAIIQDMEQAKFAGNDPNRPKYSEVKSVGSLNPAWVECLQNFPIGWTDPDCDEPEPWPGWPAMMGERLWMTPKAGACGMTAKTKGRQLEMSTHLSTQTFVAERDFADQYPYEPPRTCTGIPNRAARLKALGNSVVPAQAYPFFEAIAIMEEVRTQCNTASST